MTAVCSNKIIARRLPGFCRLPDDLTGFIGHIEKIAIALPPAVQQISVAAEIKRAFFAGSGTTEQFLRSFGVKSLDELPDVSPDRLEEFKAEAAKEVQMNLDI